MAKKEQYISLNAANLKTSTKLVRGGLLRSEFGETSEAIYLSSSFSHNSAEIAESKFKGEADGYLYSRYINPSLSMLEEKIKLLEKAPPHFQKSVCVCASGMAAMFTSIMSKINAGEHIIANEVLFGSCNHVITKILPKYGIEYTLVKGNSLQDWQEAFRSNTSMVFIETPANPTLGLQDIGGVADLCKANDALLIVDNIFATPLVQSPLELGADIVIYSTTKHMDGQGRTLGGAIIASKEHMEDFIQPFHRHTGPALSPFNAWVIQKSLETFDLRVEKSCRTAQEIAEFLCSHPAIENAIYPNLESHPDYHIAQKQMKNGGTIVSFYLQGGKQQAFNFMNGLQIIDISNNLGDAKTIATHPATTTHSNIDESDRALIGITDGLIRLSVGLEAKEDLIQDLGQALQRL